MKLVLTQTTGMAKALRQAFQGSDTDIVSIGGPAFRHWRPEEYHPRWKSWRIEDLPLLPEPRFRQVPGFQALRKKLEQKMAQADVIIHAGTPDGAGQLAIDQVLDAIPHQAEVLRLNTDRMDVESLRSCKLVNNAEWVALGTAEQCRIYADWTVGINVSRAFTLRYPKNGTASLGRASVPALRSLSKSGNPALLVSCPKDAGDWLAIAVSVLDIEPSRVAGAFQELYEKGIVSYPVGGERIQENTTAQRLFLSSPTHQLFFSGPAYRLLSLFEMDSKKEITWSLHGLSEALFRLGNPGDGCRAIGAIRSRIDLLARLLDGGWCDSRYRVTDKGRSLLETLPASLSSLVAWSQWENLFSAACHQRTSFEDVQREINQFVSTLVSEIIRE